MIEIPRVVRALRLIDIDATRSQFIVKDRLVEFFDWVKVVGGREMEGPWDPYIGLSQLHRKHAYQ
jgi:hypothetical protein